MSEYKSIKEWIVSCATSTDRNHVGPGRLICPNCACAYAMQEREKTVEEIAAMLETGTWPGNGSMDAIVTAIRALSWAPLVPYYPKWREKGGAE